MNVRRHWKATRPRVAGVLLMCLAGTALTACGGGEPSSSASDGGGDEACVSAADTYMQDWTDLPTALPDGLTPLTAAPAPGTVINLARNVSPSDLTGATAMEAAAKAAGWNFEGITHDGTPEDVNAKFAQAIGKKPTAITMASIPPAVVQTSIDAAEAAGIVVSISGDSTLPTGYPGYAANTFDQGKFDQNADIMANWALKDSGCNVHSVVVPLTLPVLEGVADQFKSTLESTCPDCSAQIISAQPTDLGSPALVNSVVSAVQADPSINYVVVTLGDLATGLDAALKAAGRDDIKIIGEVPNDASFQSLQNDTSSMWVNYGPTYNSWALFDVTLRAIQDKAAVSGLPFAVSVMTKDQLPEGYTSGELNFPEDYAAEFTKLWQVG